MTKYDFESTIIRSLNEIMKSDDNSNRICIRIPIRQRYAELAPSYEQLDNWLNEMTPELCVCDKNKLMWLTGFIIERDGYSIYITLNCVTVNKHIIHINHEDQRLQKLFIDNLKNKKYNKVQLFIKRLFRV